jgi:hypothetical protein
MRIVSAVFVVWVLGSVVSAQSEIGSDDCSMYAKARLPHYRVARREPMIHGMQLMISLAPGDVNQKNLISVGCSLGRKYRENELFTAWFFDDYNAAKVWVAGGVEENPPRGALRGSYYSDRELRLHGVDWWPDRKDQTQFVRIQLGQLPPK